MLVRMHAHESILRGGDNAVVIDRSCTHFVGVAQRSAHPEIMGVPNLAGFDTQARYYDIAAYHDAVYAKTSVHRQDLGAARTECPRYVSEP